MTIYSSAFDARHYYDEDAINIAFLEFIVGLMLGHTVRVAVGSTLDSLALHHIWNNYYDHFLKRADAYAAYKIVPLQVYVDRARFQYEGRRNVPLLVAHDYISGKIAADPVTATKAKSEDLEFSVLSTDEIDDIRSRNNFDSLRRGRPGVLDTATNAVFVESLKKLNDYCNRFGPSGAVTFVDTDDRIDILEYYMKNCARLAAAVAEREPEIAREIGSGIGEIAAVPIHLRQSTSTLIRKARQCFPSTFDTVVMPFSKALNSQLTARVLKPSVFVNFESTKLMDFKASLFEGALTVLDTQMSIDAGHTLLRAPVSLTKNSRGGSLPTEFDWDAFQNVILSRQCQQRIASLQAEPDPSKQRRLLEAHISFVAKELSELLTLEIRYSGTSSTLLHVAARQDQSLNYVVELVDLIKSFIWVPERLKDVVRATDRVGKTKAAIKAICPVSGYISGPPRRDA